jgi:hypothetical protein
LQGEEGLNAVARNIASIGHITHMHPSPAATPFEQRLADAIAALDLGELLQLDAVLAAIEDPVEGIAALSVFLSFAPVSYTVA